MLTKNEERQKEERGGEREREILRREHILCFRNDNSDKVTKIQQEDA